MDMLWHAGLSNAAWAVGLALPAALVGRWGRRPALAHGLWVLVLVKFVTPPLWSVVLHQPHHTADGVAVAAPLDSSAVMPAPDRLPDENSTGSDMVISESSPRTEDETGLSNSAASNSAPPISWASVLLVAALSGSAAWFLLAGWRLAQFRRLLRCAQPAPAAVCDQVRHLAPKLGLTRLPSVWFVPGAVSPMLWAVLGKPRLFVPAALWEHLEDDQRAALLVHELAHLRRRDHWVRRLEFVATGLYWWHPVVWWARRAIERAEEECCDAWVVWVLPQAARAYAEALVETVDFLSEVRCPLPPAVSGIGHVHFLRRRLAMIMHGTCTRKLSRPGLWGLLGLGALVLPLLPRLGPDQSAAAAPDDPTPVVSGGVPSEPPAPSRSREESKPGSERPAARPTRDRAERVLGLRQPAEELQNARDEVELLEVQLGGKHAELKEIATHLNAAERQRAQLQKLYDKGTVSEGEMAKARDAVDLAKAQLQAKEFQVKEAEVRLNQAKRRLARLQPPSREGRGAAPNPTRARLGEKADHAILLGHLKEALRLYEQEYKSRRVNPLADTQEIEHILHQLRDEINALEGKRGGRGQPETKPLLDVLEHAVKALEQYKARAEDQQRAQRALSEVEKARALTKELKAKEAAKARALEKKAADEQLDRTLNKARAFIERKQEATPQLKAMEDRLNALAKEMEALHKEIRDLAKRVGPSPDEKPKTPPKYTPPKPPAKPQDSFSPRIP